MMNRSPFTLQTLIGDRKAAVAVEFALILPIMVLLFFGGIAVTDMVTAGRKVEQATSMISDVVAQELCADPDLINETFTLAEAVLAPLPPGNLEVIISSVTVDATSVPRIAWSKATSNATPHADNSPYTLPAGHVLRKPNSSFIMAEVTYTATPVIAIGITGPITMEEKAFAIPRKTASSTGIPFEEPACI